MSSVIKNNAAGSVPARVQPKRRVPVDGNVVSEADQPATLKIASPYVLEARQLYKSYRKGRHVVPVLKGCDFQAVSGDVTAILGHSGSGKSTLLHMLGTLDALIKARSISTAVVSTICLAPSAIPSETQNWE